MNKAIQQSSQTATDSNRKTDAWPDGVGMIYLGMSPWAGMWKNRQQLMSRFAAKMPVLYVEPWQNLRRVRRAIFAGRGSHLNFRSPVATPPEGRLQIFRSPDYVSQLAPSVQLEFFFPGVIVCPFRLVLFRQKDIANDQIVHLSPHKTSVSIFRRANYRFTPDIERCIYQNTTTGLCLERLQ